MLKSIYDYTLEELKEEVKPSFRAKQIYDWIYKKYVTSYDEMKNIPQDLKDNLISNNYDISILEQVRKEESTDGSIKYLFKLRDGHTIEAVLLLMKKKKINEE